jgi:hypothetical protein
LLPSTFAIISDHHPCIACTPKPKNTIIFEKLQFQYNSVAGAVISHYARGRPFILSNDLRFRTTDNSKLKILHKLLDIDI